MRDRFLTQNDIIGLLAGIIPFFFSCSSSSSRTVNGRVVESSYFDLVAVVGGAIAALMALGILTQLSTTASEDRGKRIVLLVVMLALGGFQVLRGFGMV
ncbi:MAG: hypothetical protein PVF45_03330 [Anaerolineae bacterium]